MYKRQGKSGDRAEIWSERKGNTAAEDSGAKARNQQILCFQNRKTGVEKTQAGVGGKKLFTQIDGSGMIRHRSRKMLP